MNNYGNNKWKKILMALCVVAPIVAMTILLLSHFGIVNVSGYLPYTLFLLCPLSHLLMMPLMHKAMRAISEQFSEKLNMKLYRKG